MTPVFCIFVLVAASFIAGLLIGIESPNDLAVESLFAQSDKARVYPALFWTRNEAIELCVALEAICPKYGCHVALTGGLLYSEGPRKDCDLILYRIRQFHHIDMIRLTEAFKSIGIEMGKSYGFVNKATYRGKSIDFLLPEQTGEYDNE